MLSRRDSVIAVATACIPLPALIIGIVAMRRLGVSTQAWAVNLAATALGLLVWFIGRRLPPPAGRASRAFLAAGGIAAILLPFASKGILGVYRWVSVAGLRLHASSIVAPLIVLGVAAAAAHGIGGALAISTASAIILAVQPDAAQTTSLAAACAIVLIHTPAKQMHKVLAVALLLAVSAASFIRHDPLPPVAHVEKIVGVVASRGAGWAAMATVALLLLPAPFFAAWYRHRQPAALALGVYIAATLLAPAWGTFPVPVMGSGASPILGYFIALAAGVGRPALIALQGVARARSCCPPGP
jgi:cell division protein FtsW (lipid II flippase)